MKLDLRENMYIRTKDGIIAKVDYIDDDTIFFDKDLYRTYGDGIDFLEKDNLERIVKASYNIIDILEVGDYVNGCYIQEIKSLKDNVMVCMLDSDYEFTSTITNKDIKSIVTKEMYSSVEYRVETN